MKAASPDRAARSHEPTRVLVVDDHRVFAQGLRLLLEQDPEVSVVGIAGTATEGRRLAEETRPAVVLMDQWLADGTGIEATRDIRRERPETAVIILTGAAAEEDLLAAIEAGACGYLEKTAAPSEVLAAVRRARDGESLVSTDTLLALMRRREERLGKLEERLGARDERARVTASLTTREREVLALMAKGLDNGAIAERLSLTLHTARGYVQNVLEKLEAHSRLEAVIRANQLGLVDL